MKERMRLHPLFFYPTLLLTSELFTQLLLQLCLESLHQTQLLLHLLQTADALTLGGIQPCLILPSAIVFRLCGQHLLLQLCLFIHLFYGMNLHQQAGNLFKVFIIDFDFTPFFCLVLLHLTNPPFFVLLCFQQGAVDLV